MIFQEIICIASTTTYGQHGQLAILIPRIGEVDGGVAGLIEVVGGPRSVVDSDREGAESGTRT